MIGPIAPLFRFVNEADAIAQANATRFGLAAYFFARDVGRVWRVAEALEAGIVGINEASSRRGGTLRRGKECGIGREGSCHGIDDFLEIKYLCFGGV